MTAARHERLLSNSKLGELSAAMAAMVGSLAESVFGALRSPPWTIESRTQMTDLALCGPRKLQGLADGFKPPHSV